MIYLFIAGFIIGQINFHDQQEQHQRVHQARLNQQARLDTIYQNVSYPPKELLLIAYKRERTLEVWAKPESLDYFMHIIDYPFTAFSGELGPKRKQGDLQIPEGLYYICHYNPYSNFHLSMKINYPNRSDSILGYRAALGNEIRIHGSSVTIGCIPIGDQAIEQLYIACVDVKSKGQNRIPVYIFPCRMDTSGVRTLDFYANDTLTRLFWANLRIAYDLFTATRRSLTYSVNTQGKYVFENDDIDRRYDWQPLIKGESLTDRFAPPLNYQRTFLPSGSFGDWLRHLPLKDGNPAVLLYNGILKQYQQGHAAVIDLDVGDKDLQQCADAIIRLRAEYFYSRNMHDSIAFRITNGDLIKYRKWINGYRPIVDNDQVTWQKHASTDSSYSGFRKYLDFIFNYAGSYSLSQQLKAVSKISEIRIGDIFIQGGFPGHALLVMDIAENLLTREKIFILGQSFMPAQDFHILKNLNDPLNSPWYRVVSDSILYTPEWTFSYDDLKRF